MQTIASIFQVLSGVSLLVTGVLASGAWQFYQEKSPSLAAALLATASAALLSIVLFLLAVLPTKGVH